jgi:hypothetical protein
VITPLNFAYFTKYTIEEVIILPILAIVQGTTRMIASKLLMHATREVTYESGTFFKVKESVTNARNSLCFVSYPNDPYQAPINSLNTYVQSISNLEKYDT